MESVTEDTTTEDPDEIFGDLTLEQIDSMSSDELLAHYTGEPIDSDDGIPGGLDEYETGNSEHDPQTNNEGVKKSNPIANIDVHKILGTAGNAVDQVTKKALTLPGLSKIKSCCHRWFGVCARGDGRYYPHTYLDYLLGSFQAGIKHGEDTGHSHS